VIRLHYASGSPFAWRIHLALEEHCSKHRKEYGFGEAFTRAGVAWLSFVETTGLTGVDLDATSMPWLTA
jgi:hypothetical protein